MLQLKFINLKIAHHSFLLWVLAILITLGSAIYQRLTGPTYPQRGKIAIGESLIKFRLLRSETVTQDAVIRLAVPDTSISGYVRYKRYKSSDDWSIVPLYRDGEKLIGMLPQQPAAGKLMYFVYLKSDGQEMSLTGDQPVILRYKGAVPKSILLPHVLLMFLAMLLSNRTLFESFDAQGRSYRFMLWTIGLFFLGGIVLGPLVQKYAFGAYWTGLPFGIDLTDNKTLIAFIGWLWAWFQNRRGRDGRFWIFIAAIIMLAIYLIPHSLLGSELDYTKMAAPVE
ncbi:MAG: hypothetical protein ONB11_02175 [candidate division KSB1 bacterium]|nr:hypothetical protein [candidate division KSB1 bacterium]